jgi:phosphatidylinositol alpha-1,6-mannosyltransferase
VTPEHGAEPPTLIITNDFPPAIGGIEGFVADLCDLLDGNVVVLTRRTPGWQDHDRHLAYPVHRVTDLLLPTDAVASTASGLVVTHRIRRVIYGALAPLALLAGRLRRHGVVSQLGISHGHEVWWARVWGARRLLRRMADGLDRISVISDYTRTRIEPALSPAARARVIKLPPPVNMDRFVPIATGVPATTGPPGPRCVAAGRMIRQKGFDVLLRAWRLVLDGSGRPDTGELLLIGCGPEAAALRRQAARLQLGSTIRFTGPVGRADVAALLASGDVFALPVRTQLCGLRPEGLGKVFVEAAAAGLPVIAGRSGGTPETLIEGTTGYLVDPHDPDELARAITSLLRDPVTAQAMGGAGRRYVAQRFGTQPARQTLRRALGLD